ncbi:MAG TPA: hypothetical protein VFB73_01470 [Chloroflexota bacterium]|nr:hypothetical protein [Chloroflexota bacterium]
MERPPGAPCLAVQTRQDASGICLPGGTCRATVVLTIDTAGEDPPLRPWRLRLYTPAALVSEKGSVALRRAELAGRGALPSGRAEPVEVSLVPDSTVQLELHYEWEIDWLQPPGTYAASVRLEVLPPEHSPQAALAGATPDPPTATPSPIATATSSPAATVGVSITPTVQPGGTATVLTPTTTPARTATGTATPSPSPSADRPSLLLDTVRGSTPPSPTASQPPAPRLPPGAAPTPGAALTASPALAGPGSGWLAFSASQTPSPTPPSTARGAATATASPMRAVGTAQPTPASGATHTPVVPLVPSAAPTALAVQLYPSANQPTTSSAVPGATNALYPSANQPTTSSAVPGATNALYPSANQPTSSGGNPTATPRSLAASPSPTSGRGTPTLPVPLSPTPGSTVTPGARAPATLTSAPVPSPAPATPAHR